MKYTLIALFLIVAISTVKSDGSKSGEQAGVDVESGESDNSTETQTSENQEDFKKCVLWEVAQDRKVCICNSTYCDTLPRPTKIQKPLYYFYSSDRDGLRFNKTMGAFNKTDTNLNYNNTIFVNPTQTFQEILGFGGAFTDATGININSLNPSAQDLLLKSYFSPDGLDYNLCRVPIGGTDFSTRFYTYDDTVKPDPELKNFALTSEDYRYKIPHIQKALDLTNQTLKLFGSPWGAPLWMKTEPSISEGYIRREFYGVWADYFVKFFEEYQRNGIPFWGVTTQNEPSMVLLDVKPIPSVGWNSIIEANWIRSYLGPKIKNSPFSHVKIMILDDQKVFIPWLANSILNDEGAKRYVSGIALHWYLGVVTPCSAQVATHENFPDVFMLSTEACTGFQNSSGVILGSWDRGEAYSTDIIENLNCWIAGWVDWNMVLDLQGGPTYINNYIDSPIVVDSIKEEFYKQPMYYHLAHFSKFFVENSVVIQSRSTIASHKFMVTAYQRPDNGTVIIILNKNDEDIDVQVVDESAGVAELNIPKRSINTLVYW